MVFSKFKGRVKDRDGKSGGWVRGSLVRTNHTSFIEGKTELEIKKRCYILPETYNEDYDLTSSLVEVDEITVCEYIGWKDTDGKEIYTGDVMELEYHIFEYDDLTSDWTFVNTDRLSLVITDIRGVNQYLEKEVFHRVISNGKTVNRKHELKEIRVIDNIFNEVE